MTSLTDESWFLILENKTFDKNNLGLAEFLPEFATARRNSSSAASKFPFKH